MSDTRLGPAQPPSEAESAAAMEQLVRACTEPGVEELQPPAIVPWWERPRGLQVYSTEPEMGYPLAAAYKRIVGELFTRLNAVASHLSDDEDGEELLMRNGWRVFINHRQETFAFFRPYKAPSTPEEQTQEAAMLAEERAEFERLNAPQEEAIDHPAHYGGADNPYEVIKVAEAWGLDKDSYLFMVLKYIGRNGKKEGEPPVRELRKALWYLERRIQRLTQE